MFNDIDDLKSILSVENARIIVYDNSNEDVHSKNLTFKEYFGFNFQSKNINFKMFAYEFDNQETAHKYFENATGVKNERETTFLYSSGMKQFKGIVAHQNKAYALYTNASESEEVLNFIKTYLPEKLEIVKNTTSNS